MLEKESDKEITKKQTTREMIMIVGENQDAFYRELIRLNSKISKLEKAITQSHN